MNLAYPQTGFDSDAAAVEGFIALLTDGFENPEAMTGRVGVHIADHPAYDFTATYGPTLGIERGLVRPGCDTTVTMPLATVHRIFAEFETLDWRDPAIIGTVTFAGDLALANHLAKCCLRPSDWTRDRFRLAGAQHAEAGHRTRDRIAYLHYPTQRQVLETLEASIPVVITGLEPTPPCRDWSIDRLADRFGDAVVRVRSARHRQTMAEFVAELKEFQARPYATIIEGFRKPYTEGAALPEAMWDDFGPLFFDREDFIAPQLWLGSVPTHVPTSSLHRDPLSGFLFQVIGRKRLDLYAADQAPLLYPMKAYNNYQPCWFKPEAPDYDRFPRARHAQCLSVTLEPGQLLIQPAGWFHQVYAVDSPNMSVSYFWRY